MAILISGTTNDITINGASVATDAEVTSAVANAVPAGTIITVAKNTAPTGYLKANGALLSRTTYAALFAAIGTTFGVGDGSTTFALPDLRGYFPRGWDDSRGIDVGRVFGSTQQDDFKSHNHNVGIGTGAYAGGLVANIAQFSVANEPFSSGNSGGTETRPKNIALLYCIKY